MSTAAYTLEIAFNENVAGVFTVDGSALDGTDGLTDVGLFEGDNDDVSADLEAPIQLTVGTDGLMSAVQPSSLTVTVARVDDPDYWNPNNPASPLNAPGPGFVPMRPVRLYGTYVFYGDGDGTFGSGTFGSGYFGGGIGIYPLFYGYLRHATWRSETRSCELYCEDFLLWASRVYPTIASTGQTTVGAVFAILVAAVDPNVTPIYDIGTALDDFSADGSRSVTEILSSLLAADLGTVFVNSAGTPVYQQHDTPLAAAAAATITITKQASEEHSGIDLDRIGTRATVEKTDATGAVVATWSAIDENAEQRFGRSDIAAVSSPYVNDGAALASELVYEGVEGKQPIEFTLADVDEATLLTILSAGPNTVYAIVDDFGGNSGDVIVQQIQHTINTGIHEAAFLAAARAGGVFTVDGSALDGTDGLRYP